jgi:hypothetical protein
MTTPDIAGLCERLRAALEGVTPGPWVVGDRGSVDVFRGGTLLTSFRSNARPDDAAFIVLSREAVPALLDTLERQAAEIERLRRAGVSLLAFIDELDAYQKRPGNGDWGVECACCMGELIDRADSIRIDEARAALTGEDLPQPPNNERTG